MNNQIVNKTFLTTLELAQRWGMNRKTLQDWRRQGKGPKFLKHSGKQSSVRYDLDVIEAYEQEHAICPSGAER